MKLFTVSLLALVANGAALCLPAAAQKPVLIERLRVPIEYHPNGRIRTQILAGQAIVAETGAIDAENVRIEMFTDEGALEATVDASSCHMDRDKQNITSTGNIIFKRGNIEILGVGFQWNADEESFKIHNQARVVFERTTLALKSRNP